MSAIKLYEKELAFQADRRKATTEFIKIASDLWYDKSIEIVLFKNQVIDKNVSDIINLHEYACEFVQKPISIFDSVEILRTINDIQLPPSKLDIGKLTYEYHSDDNNYNNVKAFVLDKLKSANSKNEITPKDVVLYGFGRIGRLLARELMAKTGKGNQLRLRAIVTRGTITPEILEKRANLLRTDSVHGQFMGTVDIDFKNKAMYINGTTVHIIEADNPEDIDYTQFGIANALIIDNTGAFRDKEALSRHLKSKGSSQKVVDDSLGIKKGHIETIHAYTNDQNLVDNMHGKYRRGRAAALNMVITETGAGKAVAKALPQLIGKLTSNAIRVPVPNGSLAILNLEINNKTSKAALNTIIKKYALEGDLVEQIKYSLSNELVSTDIVGTSAPAIYDSTATIVSDDGKNLVLYIWYDNEFGYSHQVIRLAKYIAKVRRYTYY